MSQSNDMSQYLDLFLQEADEQFEILEQEILKLEDDPTADRLSTIFRAAHTLKGSSRAMGFANMANLTHEMENILDLLRASKLAISSAITDGLLNGLDMLRSARESIGAGDGDSIDSSDLVKVLQGLAIGQQATGPQADAGESCGLDHDLIDALKHASDQQTVWQADFELTSDCMMKFVRVFMAINHINSGGELLATIPHREALEEEQFEHKFTLLFTHEKDQTVLQELLSGVGEIASLHLSPWVEPQAAGKSGTLVEGIADRTSSPSTSATEAAAPATVSQTAVVNTPDQAAKKTEGGATVRVDVARLDNLMNLVGELVIDRTRIHQLGTALASTYSHDQNVEALSETVGHIYRITSDLQEQIMKARMLPIETVFNRLPRVVRDLASKVDKQVKLELAGGDTELDRSVIEVLSDPLLHILRNSLDHGLETKEGRTAAGKPEVGTIKITARHLENYIVIEIEDDGRGIDANVVKNKAVEKGLITADAAERMTEKDALQLIFSSGVSTAKSITDISGRGVGMDIVRSNIMKLGGLVDLETVLGTGTKFTLRLPLTLAIIHGLLVKVQGATYVLPLGSVVETLNLDQDDVQTVLTKEAIVLRGVTIPLVQLESIFRSRAGRTNNPKNQYVVIVGLADQRVGLVVDALIGEQEVVIKSLSRYCGDVHGISGATILGDGSVAMIVDVNALLSGNRTKAAA